MQVGPILFLAEHRYDHERGRVETTYTFVRDGRSESREATEQVYTYRALRELVERCGLTVLRAEAMVADLEGPGEDGRLPTKPFGLGAGMLLLTLERR